MPVIIQFIVLVGALAPTGAVKVAVKVRVEPFAPLPTPARLNAGVAGAITNGCVEVVELTGPL